MPTVIEGKITKQSSTYGVRLQLSNGDVIELPDIDPSIEVAGAFLSRTMGEFVDADQLRYLAEDFLGEVYGERS